MKSINRFGGTCAEPDHRTGSSAVSPSPVAAEQNFINFNIDFVKILGKSGDPIGEGEFRLLIVGADTTGRSSGMFCPGHKPIKISTGAKTVTSPCLFSLSFDEKKVGDSIFTGHGADAKSFAFGALSTFYELVTQKLGESLGKAAVKGLLKLGLKSAPVTIPIAILQVS